jgi:hypothetical protein
MSRLGRAVSTIACAFAGCSTLQAQAAPPPGTDIYLVPLRVGNGQPVIGTPVNITNRPGYDNQPSFTADSRAMLFTSIRGDAQADIYRYDIASRSTTRLTSTPESEYSATVYGGGDRFSVIRVERDSAQRLWSFRLDGTDPQLVLRDIKPVGYHAWVDSTTLALFLLGSPNALVIADTRTGRVDTLSRDVGRSLVPLPRGSGFSYVQRDRDSSWVLTAVDVRGSGRDRRVMPLPLTRLPAGADYVAWLEPAVAISGAGTKLLLWRGTETRPQWIELADLGRYGLRRISRLALSPNHAWLAIVAEPGS